ncbi:MAG TPA: FAD-dependent oxidoreductase [Beutenbergiaceae bacterium]|nr:FAD-dependent oxidoreductase [Beutenbergiaceae bacterium]
MSTENFSRPDHVVVVGAGMVGLATAWYLQEEGVQVTVLDGDGVAAGSSWGNAGWLAPSLTLPLAEPAVLATGLRALTSPNSPLYVPFRFDPRLWQFLLGFARHCTPRAWRRAIMVFNKANRLALSAYADLTDAEGAGRVAEPTKAAEPFLAAFSDEKSLQGLTEELEQVATTGGPASFEVLTGEETRALQPALSRRVTGGVHLYGQRFINPGRFASALAEAIQRRGGQIRTGSRVSAVRRAGAGIVIESGQEPVLRADAAVLATGTWLGDLARAHGVRQVVQAGRGYSFTVHPQQVPTGPVYLPAQRVACTPLGTPAEGLRVAGMMEFRGAGEPLDQRRIAAIVGAASEMFDGVDWSARTDEWVGSRPCTPDGLPLVGRTRTPGVYTAGGHGMWGVALGPLTGKLLAARIARGVQHELLHHFDPLR